jgi:hypothetical protein
MRWSLATLAIASAKLEVLLTGVAPLTAPPAILKRIVVSGRLGSVQTNAGVAIELAFNRPEVARPMSKRPKRNCSQIRAQWSGPEAAHRPSRFWACAKGLWAAGKLFPTGPLLF